MLVPELVCFEKGGGGDKLTVFSQTSLHTGTHIYAEIYRKRAKQIGNTRPNGHPTPHLSKKRSASMVGLSSVPCGGSPNNHRSGFVGYLESSTLGQQ